MFSYSYTTTVKDENGNLKTRSFQTGPLCTGEKCKCGFRIPHGKYKFATRSLRGGVTGWGDNIHPTFVVYNVKSYGEILDLGIDNLVGK